MSTATPLRIPFNRPSLGPEELRSIQAAIAGRHYSGDGPFSKRCHAQLERLVGVPRALLTTSGTHALEMAALLLDLEPGDEVIVPSFTFVSSATAFVLRGARPVFADVEADTFNLDATRLEPLLSPRTRAIVVVHYAGVACEMDAIHAIAKARGIPVVEDNAHGLFGKYRGRQLGTMGCMAALSFHETKNFTCGEGGALLVADARYAERAEIIREKGTDRSRFFRGQVDKYTWLDQGSSYLPSDLLAAYLLPQLERWEAIQHGRRRIWERYDGALQGWAARCGVRLPIVPEYCDQAYHMYYLVMPSLGHRTSFISHLRQQGIGAAFHYQPLHRSPMGQRLGRHLDDCPVTVDAADRLVRLPFFNGLDEADQASVVDAVEAWRP